MKKRLIAILLMVVMLLASCGKGETTLPFGREPIDLVIIAGKHVNSNNFYDEMLETARPLIERAVTYTKEDGKLIAEAKITLIVCDGYPRVEDFAVGEGKKLRATAQTEEIFQKNVDAMIDGINASLLSDNVKAQEPGSDLQAALDQAQKVLRSSNATEKHILIFDTGISTAGYIDMRKLNIQSGTAKEVMTQINPSAFPDLDGIHVTFLGLGNVAAPQALSQEVEDTLADFWTVYLKEGCNAMLDNTLYVGANMGEPLFCDPESSTPYPFVPTVNFTVTGNDYFEPFYSAEVKFVGESDEFVNEAEALEAIKSRVEGLKDYFKRNPDKVVYIVGSIAKIEYGEELKQDNQWSRKRAEKVLSVLTDPQYGIGFSKDQFVIIDAGTNVFTWRCFAEFDNNGVRNKANQEANRVVALIAQTDEERVQELIDAGEL